MTISVIIPTLNEAEALPTLLRALHDQQIAPAEIVIADGGSDDGTPQLAEAGGARVIRTPRGRGQQLAAGAEAATGEILFFLHADCLPAPDTTGAIAAALASDPAAIGGNFSLRFDGNDAFSRWLDDFYAFIRRHGLYYGDSGIFIRRAVYERLGGIRPIALMEDYDLVRRMERHGGTIRIDAPRLATSSRRFRGRRPAAIVLGWIRIHLLYWLGTSPNRLARLYDSERRHQKPEPAPFKDQS